MSDIYYDQFFKCVEEGCGFTFTTMHIHQEGKYLMTSCPACEGTIDYTTEDQREKLIKDMRESFRFLKYPLGG